MARQAVYDSWVLFNKNKEGVLDYMYVDQKNLVTTGMGDLIDPVEAALTMPDGTPMLWLHNSDNSPASQDEIVSEWNTMKNAGLAGTGGGNQKGHTSLHLADATVTKLVTEKLQQMEETLNSRFPSWQSWPADGQMGLLSMSWAMGPGFNFPEFEAAVNQALPDFVTAAAQCIISSLGQGDGGRNEDDVTLFTNAANVLAENADPNTLFWPGQVVATIKRTIIGVLAGFFIGGLGLLGYDWVKGDL